MITNLGSLLLLFTNPAVAAPPQVLPGHVPAVVQSLQPLGRLPETDRLQLAIGLPLRNREVLTNLLRQIYDPASPNYHHYLTPEQFAEQFGPAEKDYQAVIAFAQANGLRVTATHSNRMLVDVNGSVADVERALHLRFNIYRHPTENRTFFAPDSEPTLDLSVPILHISGLNDYSLPRPRSVATRLVSAQNITPNAGAGPGGGYMGNDFRAAYVPGVALNGSGQTIGLLQFDGYSASDIADYESQAGLPNVPLQNVLLDGYDGTPGGGSGQIEVSLDIEMAVSMAPGLSKIIVYEAGPFGNFDDILNRMATDNLAQQLSCSWGLVGGAADPTADQIFQQMAAQGQSFFAASGDSDAYTGSIDFPSDNPYITQVGGTTLTTTGPNGSWVSETVWNWGSGIGSGGGISTQYSIPAWQTNISMTANQGSTTMRNIPDVALTADNVYVRALGSDYNVGGTSCAAPLWAGFMALVNQQAVAMGQPTAGFINPAVDAIGTGSGYASAFHDITTGDNTWSSSPTKFYAVSGYDLCTGWGTPVGQKLIDALATPGSLQIKPATGFASFGGFGGPFTVTYQIFSLTNVGTNTLTWALANTSVWLNVSSTGGTLTPGGPASTVTASLNTAASNLVVGVYGATLWFTNLNDNLGQGRQFTLNVANPPVITQQPTNQAVLEGATASFTVAATGGLPLVYQWRDNGTNLADGNNISGSTTTNLIISNVSTNDVGTYTVIVTNVAGSVSSSNALLTIMPSAPVIINQPLNQTVVVGGTATFGVTVIGTTPMSYQWTKDGTNIVGATSTNYSIVNVQTNDAGNYAVVVTNIYGPVVSSNAVLTVLLAPPCLAPPSGLVSWWPAEGNANDIVGINNGTVSGTIVYTNGMVGQAFKFDGVSGYIPVPASGSLNVGAGSGFTIEGWVNYDPNVNNGPLVEWDSSSAAGVHFWPIHGLYANIKDMSGNDHIISSASGTTFANVFQHVALTYDKSSGAANLYVNGTVVASQNLGTFTPQTTYQMNIGERTAAIVGAGSIYTGLVDELSLYNRALSSNEIATIYSAGSLGKCKPLVSPNIIVQPANQMVAVGGTATFGVTATGTAPLFYQWNFNGTNIDSATNTSLILTNVQTNQAGNYAVVVANAYGSATSSNALLTVGFAPIITVQPASSTNLVGTTATFSVTASGSTPLTYQWKKNGANIGGATGTNFVITSVTTNDAGSYSVAVTNAFGSALSSNAVLTALAPPVIIVQPASQTVVVSNSVVFNVTAAGSLPLFYQWSFNGTNIANTTSASLLLTNVQFSQAGNYAALVTNAYGSITSSNAILTVIPPPSCDPASSGLVSLWPAEGDANDIAGTNNGTVSGTIVYTNGMVGRAFKFDGVSGYIPVPASASLNLGGASGFTIEGWINYDPNVNSGPLVEWDSPSAIGVHFWPIHGLYANIIDTSGISHIFSSASGTTFTNVFQHVALTYDKSSGVANLYVNGAVVASQTLGTFTPQTTYPMNIGRRTVGTGAGSTYQGLADEISVYNRALSSNEIVAIYNAGSSGKCPLPPTILSQPTSQTVMVGATTSFSVKANGSTPLFYQWTFAGTNLLSATNASLLLTNVQFAQAGSYAVQIANAGGSTNSVNATLTVNGAPVITMQPSNQTSIARGAASFTVTASGTLPLYYQWNFNSTNIDGATNVTLILTNLSVWQSGNYAVQVTNIYGSIISSNAVLVVNPLFHFVWDAVPSPRFAGAPFAVSIQAQNPTNGLATNFTDTALLFSTSGVSVSPAISGNFIQGVWTGAVTVVRTYTNLVLEAADSYGETGLANPINVISLPSLGTTTSGGTLYVFWPVDLSGFVLETTPGLSPANWVPVNPSPVKIGDQYFQPIPMSGTNAFYRLRFTGQ